MTPAQFIAIAEALHGSAWQRPLAKQLGIGERQVRFYCQPPDKGGRPIPANMSERLAHLLYAQAENLQALAKTLKLERTTS